MPGRAFRFGFVARTLAPGETWADKARRAEQLGFSVLTMPDHFRNQLAPVPALTAAALATSRLRVGSLVFAVDFHRRPSCARGRRHRPRYRAGASAGLGAGWLARSTRRRASATTPPAPGSSGLPRRSPSSRACSRASGSRSRAVTTPSPSWRAGPGSSSRARPS